MQKETTPLRVVIDASFKTSTGKSLNDIQYKGSMNQDELVNILMRFRKHKYVISADIEKMYRMIFVNPNQHNLQCILWREDPTHPLHTYSLTTLSFGVKCAPHLATRCLQQLANEFTRRDQYPEAAATITDDFSMDDLLHSGDNEQKVAEIALQVDSILRSANFKLRKWKSNSEAIVKIVSKLDGTNTNTEPQNSHPHKVLGLQWCTIDDNITFLFTDKLTNESLTKRKVLSVASSIFDPLGLIAPVLIYAKCYTYKTVVAE